MLSLQVWQGLLWWLWVIVSSCADGANVGVTSYINNSALLFSTLALDFPSMPDIYRCYFSSYLTIILVFRRVHFRTLPYLGAVYVCYHNGYLINTLIGQENHADWPE